MIQIARDAEPAVWIENRLHPFGKDVGSFIPEGFAAYARVFHPAYRRTLDGNQMPVRWRDIAAANNRTVAAEMQMLDISFHPSQTSASGEELWNEPPEAGKLPREIAVRFAAALRPHTLTPQSCWLGVWVGYPDVRRRFGAAPGFSVPQRDFLLLHGTVDDASGTLSCVDWIHQSPNLWWPEDKAWCVATEIDFTWSYVGGSQACIEEILSDSELEALPTSAEEGNFMQTKEWVSRMWAEFDGC